MAEALQQPSREAFVDAEIGLVGSGFWEAWREWDKENCHKFDSKFMPSFLGHRPLTRKTFSSAIYRAVNPWEITPFSFLDRSRYSYSSPRYTLPYSRNVFASYDVILVINIATLLRVDEWRIAERLSKGRR